MIHIADTKVARRYGDFFIRQIHKFEEVIWLITHWCTAACSVLGSCIYFFQQSQGKFFLLYILNIWNKYNSYKYLWIFTFLSLDYPKFESGECRSWENFILRGGLCLNYPGHLYLITLFKNLLQCINIIVVHVGNKTCAMWAKKLFFINKYTQNRKET